MGMGMGMGGRSRQGSGMRPNRSIVAIGGGAAGCDATESGCAGGVRARRDHYGRGTGCAGRRRLAGRRGGELASAPQRKQFFQPAEQAAQSGQEQGVHRRHHSAPGCAAGGLGADRGGDAGDLRGQG